MKKRLIIPILIAASLLAGYYIHDALYYKDEVPFASPLNADVVKLRYDKFGDGHFAAKRKNDRAHTGIDILAERGEPVVAAKSGWAKSKFDLDGYGNYVVIRHKDGYTSRYGHLESANMRWIKKVKQGDVIGWAGCTGNARCEGMRSHLHFEIRKDGVPVDPGACLKEPIVK
ncbi:MAG: M23 family metallopeptidase [Candidatus Omnitrophota bacterium]